jgi:sterol desaturase/sphingolipid hydroxylase (fatty acid hydroxylase superfamily)
MVDSKWLNLLEGASQMFALMLVPLLPLEIWGRWRAGRLGRASILEMVASASLLVPFLLTGGIVVSVVTRIYGGASRLAPWTIPTNGLTVVAAILIADFLYYWDHRTAHRFRPYWAIAHSVHHSSPQYDQTVGLRISFVDGFISPWFYLPMVLAGFDPLLVAGALGVVVSYQQWIHTETVDRLPCFDGWLNTPSNHRVHHGAQAQYVDRNYGGILIVWDRLFGTYAPEVEPVRYGLTKPIDSHHPWRIHTAEIGPWIRDVRAARGLRDVIRRLCLVPDGGVAPK